MERMSRINPQDIYLNPTANITTVDPVERITVTIEQTTGTRLVQLPTLLDISDTTMDRDSGDSEYQAPDDEPEEILRRLDRQVRDLIFFMEARLYWCECVQCEPEEDIEVLDGLESILQMELRLFQIVLSLREEIRRLQRSGISRVLSAQETL